MTQSLNKKDLKRIQEPAVAGDSVNPAVTLSTSMKSPIVVGTVELQSQEPERIARIKASLERINRQYGKALAELGE